eukprot:g1968.t1
MAPEAPLVALRMRRCPASEPAERWAELVVETVCGDRCTSILLGVCPQQPDLSCGPPGGPVLFASGVPEDFHLVCDLTFDVSGVSVGARFPEACTWRHNFRCAAICWAVGLPAKGEKSSPEDCELEIEQSHQSLLQHATLVSTEKKQQSLVDSATAICDTVDTPPPSPLSDSMNNPGSFYYIALVNDTAFNPFSIKLVLALPTELKE